MTGMSIDIAVIATIATKGWQDARRHRWFVVFAVVFAGLALTLSAAGFWGTGIAGLAGFGRTGVSLTNLFSATCTFSPSPSFWVGRI